MTESPRRISSLTLGWWGIAIALLGCAFAIRPVHASRPIFWGVVGAGCATLLAGGIVSLWRTRRPRRQLLADECFRICAALNALISEQERRRPRKTRFRDRDVQLQDWLGETGDRYERELRAWAERLFQSAVRQGSLSSTSRPLLTARSLEQLRTLSELFRDAGESLAAHS
jgi:hypothetical protein